MGRRGRDSRHELTLTTWIATVCRSVGSSRRAALIVALGTLLAPAPVGASSFADAINRQRAQISANRHRLELKRQQLNFEELRERDLQRQLGETAASIALVQGRIGTLDQQIANTTDAEEQARRRLDAAQDALRRQRRASDHRLVQMYERPSDRLLAVLFGATSFIDLTERWHDLALVAHEDQREIVDRTAAVRRVTRAQEVLLATSQRLQSERAAKSQEQSQLSALGRQRSDLVSLADAHRMSVAREVHVLEDLTAQEEAQLEALIREQEAEIARQRRAGRIPTPPAPRIGGMQWPLRGPITSPFGMRLNPFTHANTEFHPGIDIAVDVGTTVAAAAAGRVIIAGWVSGYGNYIAIDHGNGLSTGYGHLSTFYVTVGQDVQAGQAIGASGNTGRSTGPHLIFEVRRGGMPIDPTPYLP